MASITTNIALNTHSLSNVFAQFKDRAVKLYMYRKTVSELRSLSRLELADLGLNYGNIKSVAREAVYGA